MKISRKVDTRLKKLSRTVLFYKHALIKLKKATVTFTFDDVPRSALTNGISVLDRHDVNGTFYLSMSLMNGIEDSDRLILDAVEQGHEIACHTYGHLRLPKVAKSQIQLDIEKNQREFNRLLPSYTFRNFAYPYGLHDAAAKSVVSGRFDTARTVEAGLNTGHTDLNRLKAVKLYERLHTLDQIYRQIDSAEENKAWLIFYTHDVCDDFSDHGCSTAYLESVLGYCVERELNVLPVGATVDLIRQT